MDAKRAREIAASPNMVNVICNGEPIYIERISSDDATARVHTLSQPGKSRNVSLSNLVEQ